MPFYSDQGFSEIENPVSLLYNYSVLQSLKLYYDWYFLDRWIYIILYDIGLLCIKYILCK